MINEISTKTVEQNFDLAIVSGEKFGWKIIKKDFPFIHFAKEQSLAIKGPVDVIWNAEECIVCTILYHETKNQFGIKFRRLLKKKALDKLFGYPKAILSVELSRAICTLFYKDRPNNFSIIELWNLNPFKKNK